MRVKHLAGLLSLLLLVGCGVSVPKDVVWQEPDVDLVWPQPPAQERIRYLRSLKSVDDFKKNDRKTKAWRWLFGDDANDIPLLTPLSVAAGSEGTVWVADSGSKMLYRFDLIRQKVEYLQELNGQQFVLPAGLAYDDNTRRVYLSDAMLNMVFVVDDNGAPVERLAPPDGFRRPAGMALDALGNLYVADVLDGSVAVFDGSGQFRKRIYSKVSEGGRFQRPIDVAIGPDGEVVVLDAASFHLEVQSSNGDFLRTIGKIGDAPGHFARPKGVAVNSRGHIFVTDAAFDNIQVFDMTGQLLMHWGGAGDQSGEFSLPAGVFVDKENRIYVADSYNSRVQVYQGL
jgi:sugar lactone lactonase YvrE